MMVLPGSIFRKYFARVVLPEQVAPLEEKWSTGIPGECSEYVPNADDDYSLFDHRLVWL